MRSVFIGLVPKLNLLANSNSVDFATYLEDNASQFGDNIY